jgi:hypothetical protein
MSPNVYDAIKTHLDAGITETVLDFDELDFQLEQGSDPFCVIEEVYAYEDQIAFGDPENVCMEESGSFVVHCFVRAPESSGAARLFGESVRTAMRFSHLLNGNLKVLECDPPDVRMLNNGLWTSAGVNISYTFNFHVSISD